MSFIAQYSPAMLMGGPTRVRLSTHFGRVVLDNEVPIQQSIAAQSPHPLLINKSLSTLIVTLLLK